MENNAVKTYKYINEIKLGLIYFCICNILFLYYQITFFIGNHDWDWVKGTTQVLSWDTGLFEGRYAKFILNVCLYGGQILPILNNLTAFGLLSFGLVLLSKYWQIAKRSSQIIMGTFIISSPYIWDWLYFPINIIGNFAAIPLVVGGLIWAENKQWYYKTAAIICFLIALGVYPSVVEMMIVCWAIKGLLEKKISKSALGTMSVSLIFFVLILKYLTYKNIIYTGHYNVQTADWAEMLKRIPDMVVLAFSQLYMSIPFFPNNLKIIGILIITGAVIKTLQEERKFRNLILWCVGLGATIVSAFLAARWEEAAYMARINFYGVNFLYVGALAVLLKEQTPKIGRNIGLMLGILFVCLSAREGFYAQKVWQLGKTAEEKMIERISGRIESRLNSSAQSIRIPIVAGEQSLRPRYYHETYQKDNPYMLTSSFMVRHIPAGILNFYAAKPIYAGQSQIGELTVPLYIFLRDAKAPWPSDKGLYVDDIYAIILLSKAGIEAIQAQIPK